MKFKLIPGTGSLLLIILTMVGLIVWLLLNPNPVGHVARVKLPVTASLSSKTKAVVVAYCQELVRQSLKAPSSADFPWDTEVRFENEGYVVESWVEAANSFNAKIRTPYLCHLKHAGNDEDSGWSAEQFILGD